MAGESERKLTFWESYKKQIDERDWEGLGFVDPLPEPGFPKPEADVAVDAKEWMWDDPVVDTTEEAEMADAPGKADADSSDVCQHNPKKLDVDYREKVDKISWRHDEGPRQSSQYRLQDCISKFKVFEEDVKKAHTDTNPANRTPYTTAAVFAFHISDVDFELVPERDAFLAVLSEKYGFQTETYVVDAKAPEDSWEPNLRYEMKKFRQKYGRPEHGRALLMVYYGGHGHTEEQIDWNGDYSVGEFFLSSGSRDIYFPRNFPEASKPAQPAALQSVTSQSDSPQSGTSRAEEPPQLEALQISEEPQETTKIDRDSAPSKQKICKISWSSNLASDWMEQKSFDTLLVFDCCEAWEVSATSQAKGVETIAGAPRGMSANAEFGSLTMQLTRVLEAADGQAISAAQMVAKCIWLRGPHDSRPVHVRPVTDKASVVLYKAPEDHPTGIIRTEDCYFHTNDPNASTYTGVLMKFRIVGADAPVPRMQTWNEWVKKNLGLYFNMPLIWIWESDEALISQVIIPYEIWAYIQPRTAYITDGVYCGPVHGKLEPGGCQRWEPLKARYHGYSNHLIREHAEPDGMTKTHKRSASFEESRIRVEEVVEEAFDP